MISISGVEFTKENLSLCPFLEGFASFVETEEIRFSKEQLELVRDALDGKTPSDETLKILDFMGVERCKVYSLACAYEDRMRERIYSFPEEYSDPYNNFIHLDNVLLSSFANRTEDENLLFDQNEVMFCSMEEAKQVLSPIMSVFELGNLFLAGGSVFSALTRNKINDWDFFVYGIGQEDAEEKLYEIVDVLTRTGYLKKKGNLYPKISRTKNAITIVSYKNARCFKSPVQIILRLYSTPSEILHGFDVDSCCVGFDGKNFYATERAVCSFSTKKNVVNFDRLSPSYEYRLAKYGLKGMAVSIPNFQKKRVVFPECDNPAKLCKKENGLGILICLHEKMKTKEKLYEIRDMASQRCDYLSSVSSKMNATFQIEALLKEFGSILEYKDYKYITEEYGVVDFKDKEEKIIELYGKIDTKNHSSLLINYIPIDYKLRLVEDSLENINKGLSIRQDVFDFIEYAYGSEIPRNVEWKVACPGEQMTGTFHKTVLDDNSVWYKTEYYK